MTRDGQLAVDLAGEAGALAVGGGVGYMRIADAGPAASSYAYLNATTTNGCGHDLHDVLGQGGDR